MFAAIPALLGPLFATVKALGVSALVRARAIVAAVTDEYADLAASVGEYVKNVLLRALTLAVIVYFVTAIVAAVLAALTLVAPLWILFKAVRSDRA